MSTELSFIVHDANGMEVPFTKMVVKPDRCGCVIEVGENIEIALDLFNNEVRVFVANRGNDIDMEPVATIGLQT